MARIEFRNDVTRATEETEGSDGRLNVSSRQDGRSYYISRDQGQAYSTTFSNAAAADGDFSFFLKNTSTTKTLVIDSIGVNTAVDTTRVKLWFASIASQAGDAVTPVNLNKDSSNDAQCTFLEHNTTAIATITKLGGAIDDVQISTSGHEELRLVDRVRLGQNDAVVLEVVTTANTPIIFGVCFFYFE